jgi:aryl-alcohol dehydrogenase-like predicted oxidoreductase
MTEPSNRNTTSMVLGRTELFVSRLGIGAMVWGDMSTAPRWSPARNAYGPTSSADEQREALEVSLAAGVNFLDTAAMYGKGASERRRLSRLSWKLRWRSPA